MEEAKSTSAAKHTPGPWRIERSAKMQFCVARETADGKEFRQSASGKVSNFKTWAAAHRVMRRLNEDAATEAELRAKYVGEKPLPSLTLGAAIAHATGERS